MDQIIPKDVLCQISDRYLSTMEFSKLVLSSKFYYDSCEWASLSRLSFPRVPGYLPINLTTSPAFRLAKKVGQFKAHPGLTALSISKLAWRDQELKSFLAKALPPTAATLRELNLERANASHMGVVAHHFPAMSALASLSIVACANIRNVFQSLTSLRKLTVSQCILDQVDLTTLTNLTDLEISRCPWRESLLSAGIMSSLTRLDVAGVTGIQDFLPPLLASHGSKLRVLNISKLHDLSFHFLDSLSSLTELNMNLCDTINSSTFVEINKVTTLVTLHVSSDSPDIDKAAIGHLSNLRSLTYLDINNAGPFSDTAWMQVAVGSPKLRFLSARVQYYSWWMQRKWAGKTSAALLDAVLQLFELRSLDLTGAISKEGDIADWIPRLARLTHLQHLQLTQFDEFRDVIQTLRDSGVIVALYRQDVPSVRG